MQPHKQGCWRCMQYFYDFTYDDLCPSCREEVKKEVAKADEPIIRSANDDEDDETTRP
jgi:hypothetical protein